MKQHDFRPRLIAGLDELPALKSEWEGLLRRCAEPIIFLEWDWCKSWLEYFREQAWIVAIRDGTGTLRGLAPWTLGQRPLLREIHFIGSGLTQADHLDILAAPEDRDAVDACIADFLVENRNAWDLLNLSGLSETSSLPGALRSRLGQELQRADTPCPYISFAGIDDWAHFQKTRLSSHMRSKGLRYLQNVLKRENPEQVFYEQITDPEALGPALSCLIEQHQQRWAEKETYTPFEDPAFLDFHRNFARIALAQGWLGLYRLRIAEATIATVYGFHYGGKFYDYQHALDNRWSKFSPGRQLIAHIVEKCISRGATEYDFLCGTEKYKYSWTATERHDRNLLWASGWRGQIPLLALRAKDALKRWRDRHAASAGSDQ